MGYVENRNGSIVVGPPGVALPMCVFPSSSYFLGYDDSCGSPLNWKGVVADIADPSPPVEEGKDTCALPALVSKIREFPFRLHLRRSSRLHSEGFVCPLGADKVIVLVRGYACICLVSAADHVPNPQSTIASVSQDPLSTVAFPGMFDDLVRRSLAEDTLD